MAAGIAWEERVGRAQLGIDVCMNELQRPDMKALLL
jgi:hypothetical protein